MIRIGKTELKVEKDQTADKELYGFMGFLTLIGTPHRPRGFVEDENSEQNEAMIN